ncbi:MAG TPA: hypothetical protein VJZ00_08365 [Thermoanaerobaculia bacterium]|nr:hypothetical protein [Thermoanaerobaculia bacterium]
MCSTVGSDRAIADFESAKRNDVLRRVTSEAWHSVANAINARAGSVIANGEDDRGAASSVEYGDTPLLEEHFRAIEVVRDRSFGKRLFGHDAHLAGRASTLGLHERDHRARAIVSDEDFSGEKLRFLTGGDECQGGQQSKQRRPHADHDSRTYTIKETLIGVVRRKSPLKH